jgi:Tfp pilus assembly PilM family ATPase
MLDMLLKTKLPVGVEINRDIISIAQLKRSKKQVGLVAARRFEKPDNIIWQSEEWINWVVGTFGREFGKKWFKNVEAVGSLPSSELFIENLKIEGNDDNRRFEQKIVANIEEKLPCSADELLIKTAGGEQGNYVVMAVRRDLIEKYLEIYKRLGLDLKAMGVWPVAVMNTYVNFFGRRKTDRDAVVMLINFTNEATNIVVCRHNKLLFAESLQITKEELISESGSREKLVVELTAAVNLFKSIYEDTDIERAVFFPTSDISMEFYADLAGKLNMPAQIGDCLKAVEIEKNPDGQTVERRDGYTNWATVFGLSLYGSNNA